MTRTAAAFLAASAGLLAVFSSTPARAWDDTGYHAAECVEAGTPTADFNRSEYRITRTGAAGAGVLLCPIDRQSYTVCSVSEDITVTVNILDTNTATDATCVLYVRNATGDPVTWDSMTTVGSSGQNVLSLTVPHAGSNMNKYVLRCTLPTNNANGFFRFYGYKVHEPEGCE